MARKCHGTQRSLQECHSVPFFFTAKKTHKSSSAKPYRRGWHALRPVAHQAKRAMFLNQANRSDFYGKDDGAIGCPNTTDAICDVARGARQKEDCPTEQRWHTRRARNLWCFVQPLGSFLARDSRRHDPFLRSAGPIVLPHFVIWRN